MYLLRFQCALSCAQRCATGGPSGWTFQEHATASAEVSIRVTAGSAFRTGQILGCTARLVITKATARKFHNITSINYKQIQSTGCGVRGIKQVCFAFLVACVLTLAPHQSQNRASEWFALLHLEQGTIFPMEEGRGGARCPPNTG